MIQHSSQYHFHPPPPLTTHPSARTSTQYVRMRVLYGSWNSAADAVSPDINDSSRQPCLVPPFSHITCNSQRVLGILRVKEFEIRKTGMAGRDVCCSYIILTTKRYLSVNCIASNAAMKRINETANCVNLNLWSWLQIFKHDFSKSKLNCNDATASPLLI